MIRSGLAVAVLALLGLFGYYFVSDRGDKSGTDKAKDAIAQVGDTVVDRGVAGLVQVRLATTFGLQATQFLHVHHNEGHVLIYGLLPENLTEQAIVAEAQGVPGVKDVSVLFQPRPAGLGVATTANDTSAKSGGD
ncbi:MAG: hypothetical protein KKB50_02895 [Planctomycetes bacterium]|nr:hypothetical protein [Planctomycetota bacterium]